MKITLADFSTSVEELQREMEAGDYIEQNHFGDHLMIDDQPHNMTHYKVWLNHEENVAQGESVWEIEYCGCNNGYKWETVAKGNN
jgi:hypothetical protein